MKHLLAVISAILLFTPVTRAETGPQPITVGVLASLSDEWAPFGDSIVKGATLAAEEVNARGGIGGRKLELAVEDSREASSGAAAVTAYRSLRQRGVRFFIGPTGTPAGLALAPIARTDTEVVMITPSVGVGDFSDAAPNLFNARGVDAAASRAMARYAKERGWKRAAVFASEQPWESAQGRAFQGEFEKGGGKIAAYESPLPEENNLKGPSLRIVQSKPDVIFFSNLNRLPLASRELSALKYKGPRLAAILDPKIIEAAAGTLDGAMSSSFTTPGEKFVKTYEKRFGAEPSFGADTAYDAMRALIAALEKSGPEFKDVPTPLKSVKFEGAAGEFSFADDRVARRGLKHWRVEGPALKEIS